MKVYVITEIFTTSGGISSKSIVAIHKTEKGAIEHFDKIYKYESVTPDVVKHIYETNGVFRIIYTNGASDKYYLNAYLLED